MTHQSPSKDRVPTRWALLIGINHYLDGDARGKQRFGPLYGCVNDVTRMDKYLSNMGRINITKLTSTASNRGGQSPLESQKNWPTHDNVVKELTRIHDYANRGDLVYIHYSGHGISRSQTHIRDEGNPLSGTALAMMDVNKGGSYLSGYELGVYVRRMVEAKGLRVTVVLDSCFSGEGFREGDGSLDQPSLTYRTSDFSFDDSWLPSDYEAYSAARKLDSEHRALGLADRDAVVEHSWLSKPVGSTVICACDRDQKAAEAFLPDAGDRTGLLTHWMLDLLNRHSEVYPPSSAKIRGHAAQQLEAMKLKQTPRVHGESFYQFFGEKRVIHRPECIVTSVDKNGIALNVGKAQGVAIGARYHVYPQNQRYIAGTLLTDVGPQQDGMIEVKITKTLDLSSDAVVLANPNSPRPVIRPGDRAIPYRWAFGKPIYIQLLHLPSKITKALRASLESIPGLKVAPTGLVDLIISADPDNTFTISDGTHKTPLKRLPRLPLDGADSLTKLTAVTRHLARFLSLRRISHLSVRSLAATSGISAQLLDSRRRPVPLDPRTKRYLVQEGQSLTISVRNLTPQWPTHVTFLCLNSVWGVDKLSPPDGQPATSLDGTMPEEVSVSMAISRRPGDGPYVAGGADETLRVCVCMGTYPVSWDELELQGLPVDGKLVWGAEAPLEPLAGSKEGKGREGVRGDGPVKLVRQGEEVPRREWMFLDFDVRTMPKVERSGVSRKAGMRG